MEFLVAMVLATTNPTIHRELMVVTPHYVETLEQCEDYALRAAGEYLSNGQATAIISMRCINATTHYKGS